MNAALPADFLGLGFTFADLSERDGLIRLDGAFLDRLAARDPELSDRLLAARAAPDEVTGKDESELLIALGPALDVFVGELFRVEPELSALNEATLALDPIHACKRLFVQRRAVKAYPDPSGFDGPALRATLETRFNEPLTDASFARHVDRLEKSADADVLDLAARYAAWATLTPAGQAAHPGTILFHVPRKLDPPRLIPLETIERDGVRMLRLPEHDWRHRDGFGLTDPGMGPRQALDQMNYCIWCHTQGKDSCSKGLGASWHSSVANTALATQ